MKHGNILIFVIAMDFSNLYLDHFVNIAFGSCEFGGIFDLYQDCKVEIMPHIMLSSDVFFKRDMFVVEGFPFQTY